MKGLDFIAIDPGIAQDPRIMAIAKSLKKDRWWVAGHLPLFFGQVAEHAPDGDLSAIDDELLDDWSGNVRGLGALIREHLCESGVLRAWWKYNGRALDQLRKDRERQAEKRGKIRGQSTDTPPDKPPTTPRKIQRDSTGYTVTVTETELPSPVGAGSSRPTAEKIDLEARLRALLGDRGAGFAGELENVLASSGHNRHGTVLALLRMLDPVDGGNAPNARPCTADEVAFAISRTSSSGHAAWHQVFGNKRVLEFRAGPPPERTSTGGDPWADAARRLDERERLRSVS